jgi:TonB family protein
MRAPLIFKAFLLAATLYAAAFGPASRSAFAAQSGRRGQEPELRLLEADVTRGKKLLEEGDAEGAVKILRGAAERDKEDDAAWHYLGVALARAGQTNEALKASERAVELRSRVFIFEFNNQRKADGEWSAGDSSRLRARFAARTGALIESVEAFVALGPEDVGLWREWLTTLRLYAQVAADPKFETEPFRLAALMTRANVLRKPEPRYTERARRSRISGVVRVRALLGADGKVKGVTVIKGLGGGLSESAITAARAIEFTPATVGGRPVSQFVMLEYNFWVF